MAHKRGICQVCGGHTSRLTITTCKWCLNPTTHKKSAEVAREIDRRVELARDEIAAMVADASARMPRRLPKPRPKPTGIMLELMIPDLHLGKLAWGEETGYGNYDSKEACRLYREAVSTLVARTAHWSPEFITLIVGNDFFHSDNKQGTTTKGTPLDNDSRFAKMFRAGRQMMTDVIEALHAHAPVRVICQPGNHDSQSAWLLGEALECWFRHTPTVEVLNAPTPRKYMEWGAVLLMWEHGDKGKREDTPLLMAVEQPEAFGRTAFREIHTGHLHKVQTNERMGIRVRVCPALCDADAWHSESHYVGNMRQAEAFVWSKEEGLIAQAFYTVREER